MRPAENRSPVRRRSIRLDACERAGLEDFHFHDLRHDAASRVVMNGGSLYDAQGLLGQRSMVMTQRYAHLSPGYMEEVANLTMRRPKPAVVELDRTRLGS